MGEMVIGGRPVVEVGPRGGHIIGYDRRAEPIYQSGDEADGREPIIKAARTPPRIPRKASPEQARARICGYLNSVADAAGLKHSGAKPHAGGAELFAEVRGGGMLRMQAGRNADGQVANISLQVRGDDGKERRVLWDRRRKDSDLDLDELAGEMAAAGTPRPAAEAGKPPAIEPDAATTESLVRSGSGVGTVADHAAAAEHLEALAADAELSGDIDRAEAAREGALRSRAMYRAARAEGTAADYAHAAMVHEAEAERAGDDHRRRTAALREAAHFRAMERVAGGGGNHHDHVHAILTKARVHESQGYPHLASVFRGMARRVAQAGDAFGDPGRPVAKSLRADAAVLPRPLALLRAADDKPVVDRDGRPGLLTGQNILDIAATSAREQPRTPVSWIDVVASAGKRKSIRFRGR